MDVGKIIKELYEYFDVKLAGSMLLYREKILPLDLVDDIDLLVSKEVWNKVKQYFVNNGFTHEIDNMMDEYGSMTHIHSELIMKHQELKSFHLLKSEEPQYTITKLLQEKLERCNKRDILHLQYYLQSFSADADWHLLKSMLRSSQMKNDDKAFMKSRIRGKNVPEELIQRTCVDCGRWNNVQSRWCEFFNDRGDVHPDNAIMHILDEGTKMVVLCDLFEDTFERQF